ncbi:MAG: hypothetical protein GMKNLPBB_00118 [Myxococcota bacterium]|nr:hypothetical protein [Myxococcota bacterium]
MKDGYQAEAGNIRCELLEPHHWDDLARLFGPNGACGGCWCMWWRVERGGKTWDDMKGAKAQAAFRKLVESGAARGVLAYDGGEPVGWCAFGPRADFPRLDRVKAYAGSGGEGVWSINCFYLPAKRRGQGVARKLLRAAVEGCRAGGARVIEGYPITSTVDGRKIEGVFAFTGPEKIFLELGFARKLGSEPHKPVVRLEL